MRDHQKGGRFWLNFSGRGKDGRELRGEEREDDKGE
jgi:hypothetical protein